MKDNARSIIAKATVTILRPLVRIMLHFEISHSEFAELAKRAYVDMAYKHFTIPNRKKTYSRVAVISGLSRKEVVRLTQTQPEEPPEVKGPLNRASRVISGWLLDADFNDPAGRPRILPLRGDSCSFEQLVARYSGDITSRAILDELLRVGAIDKPDRDKVRLLHHGYIPQQGVGEKFGILSDCVADLLSSGIHNINCEPRQARFQRQVAYTELPLSVIQEFQNYSHERCSALLLELNQWLAQKKQEVHATPDEPKGRAGVGIYYFNNDE